VVVVGDLEGAGAWEDALVVEDVLDGAESISNGILAKLALPAFRGFTLRMAIVWLLGPLRRIVQERGFLQPSTNVYLSSPISSS